MRGVIYLLFAVLSVCLHNVSQASESITIGQTYLAASSDPAKGSTGWALTSHGVAQNLYTVNKNGELVPLLAEAITRQEDLVWLLTLKSGVKFSDGSLLTGAEVAASLNRTTQENPIARSSGGSMTFEPIGNLQVKITTERPVALMAAVLAEWAFPIYRMTDQGPIFTGPYQIERLKPNDEILLTPNAHYPDAQTRPDIRIKKFSDAQALALAFEAGEIDLAFNLPVELLPRLKSKGLRVKSFPVAYQYYAFLQTTSPLLQDVRVRQALDLAIDREMLVAAISSGQPATGAYSEYFPFSLKEPRPHDQAKANELLDSAGWKMGPDKIRQKDGKTLQLSLYAYPQRPDLVTFLPVIKALLADIGIGIDTHVSSAVSELAKSGKFDILLYAQNTAPSGEPGFFLNQTFRTDASNNYCRYSSTDLDAIIDQMGLTSDQEKRAELSVRAQNLLFEDVPVLFLVSPQWHVGLSNRLADYVPWGSDYYIIRPDLRISK